MGFRVIGGLRRRLRSRRRSDRLAARSSSEAGFSLVETVMALGLVFTVMLGLLASLSTGIRGLTTGRQQTGATALAKEVVEQFRAVSFENIGHDLGNDATLATDPAIVTDGDGDLVFEPEGGDGPEKLVGSGNPPYPEHEIHQTRDSVAYTARWYITEVAPPVGATFKRLTVTVAWDNDQYRGALADEVALSTFVSPHGIVSDDVTGVVDVDSGIISVTGTLEGIDLARAQIFFPVVHADTESDMVVESRGLAGSARMALDLNSGSASGCGSSGTSIACDGVKAETAADNDGKTELPFQHVVGPLGNTGENLTAGTPLSLSLGAAGTVVSKSSAQSCNVAGCSGGLVGDGDFLAYAFDEATGPASMSAGFEGGIVTGDLVASDTAGSATATVDQDQVSGSSLLTSVGELVVPAVDILALDVAPLGYTAAARISGVDVTATAQAGPTAAGPTVTGDTITVSAYKTGFLSSGYVDITFAPGAKVNQTVTATFDVLDLGLLNAVTLETTVRSDSASTSTVQDGTTITKAQANLTNWFTVTTRLVVRELGVTVVDLTIEVDYGRVSAQAEVGS